MRLTRTIFAAVMAAPLVITWTAVLLLWQSGLLSGFRLGLTLFASGCILAVALFVIIRRFHLEPMHFMVGDREMRWNSFQLELTGWINKTKSVDPDLYARFDELRDRVARYRGAKTYRADEVDALQHLFGKLTDTMLFYQFERGEAADSRDEVVAAVRVLLKKLGKVLGHTEHTPVGWQIPTVKEVSAGMAARSRR